MTQPGHTTPALHSTGPFATSAAAQSGAIPGQPSGPPAAPPGRRIPGWITGVAIATAVASVVTFTTVLLWPGADGRTDGPLEFHAFTHSAWIPFEQSALTGLTTIAGERGYAAWQHDNGELGVVAFDLASGEEHWRKTVPRSADWRAIRATDNELLVFSGGAGDPRDISVRDARTGAERWRLQTSDSDRLFPTYRSLVWEDSASGTLRGLDLITGDDDWSHPLGEDARVVGVSTSATLTRPTYPSGTLVTAPQDDEHLVIVHGDRSVEVVNGDDGATVAEGTNVAGPGDLVRAHDDRLYVAPDENGYQVQSVPLTNLSATPRTHYSPTETDRSPQQMRPCGGGHICIIEENADDETDVVAVDTQEAQTHWRHRVPGASGVIAVGDWTVINADPDDYGDRVAVVGSDGDQRLEGPGQGARLNGGNLLLFDPPLSTSRAEISAQGLPVGGEPVDLGRSTEVLPAQCSWNSHFLLCPGDDGATVLRFAAA